MKLEHEKVCRETHEKLDQWLAEKEAKKLKMKMVSCPKYLDHFILIVGKRS